MPGRVTVKVLLVVGDDAHVRVLTRFSTETVMMPAAKIAEQAGLPENELPGREFTVLRDGNDLTDFRLVHDPRL